jgi:hypothetical protein
MEEPGYQLSLTFPPDWRYPEYIRKRDYGPDSDCTQDNAILAERSGTAGNLAPSWLRIIMPGDGGICHTPPQPGSHPVALRQGGEAVSGR